MESPERAPDESSLVSLLKGTGKEMKQIAGGLSALALIKAMDIATTAYGINHPNGGIELEVNPISRYVIENYGIDGLIYKGVVSFAAAGALAVAFNKIIDRPWGNRFLWVTNVLYGLIVVNNLMSCYFLDNPVN